MAPIPQSFIDDLIARTDIVATVEARLPLKKAGNEYQARCPFHEEKTPSFTVSPAKQFYHCFGCGAHGTAISFVMAYDQLPFPEAVELLAEQAGMAMPRQAGRDSGDRDRQQPLFDALTEADRAFRRQLRATTAAIDYLKGRGIRGETAKAFGIGYAPPAWDFLRKRLRDRRPAVAAGLLIEREDGHSYDRFRNRIMFPIRDARGRTIAFGGRALADDTAKYLNSPETPLFQKGRCLYGLFEARQALKDIPRLLLVEGYMDVVALAQHGIRNVVATLGTATTAEHLRTLFRVTDEVIFCFDGDSAGRRAAWRALDNALPTMRGTRRVRFLFLPEGEDPDSLVRGENGAARLSALADESRPASEVLLSGLSRGLETSSADGRSRLVEKARPFVQKLPPEAFKAELVREIAARSGLPAADLERIYASVPDRQPSAPARPTQDGNRSPAPASVRRALQLLFNDPALADSCTIEPDPEQPQSPWTAVLTQAIEFFRDDPQLTVAAFFERLRGSQETKQLECLAGDVPRGDADDLGCEFRECVARVFGRDHSQRDRARYAALLEKQERGPLSDIEATELQERLHRLRAYARRS